MSDPDFPKRFSQADKALWLAIQARDPEAVEKALLAGASLEIRDKNGMSPAMSAVSASRYGDPAGGEILDMLLAAGASPFATHTETDDRYEDECREREHDCDGCPRYDAEGLDIDCCEDVITLDDHISHNFAGTPLERVYDDWMDRHGQDPGLLARLRREHGRDILDKDPGILPGKGGKTGKPRV